MRDSNPHLPRRVLCRFELLPVLGLKGGWWPAVRAGDPYLSARYLILGHLPERKQLRIDPSEPPSQTATGVPLEDSSCDPSPYRGINVEIRRFELRASSMPWKRATSCAISPKMTAFLAPRAVAGLLLGRCCDRVPDRLFGTQGRLAGPLPARRGEWCTQPAGRCRTFVARGGWASSGPIPITGPDPLGDESTSIRKPTECLQP